MRKLTILFIVLSLSLGLFAQENKEKDSLIDRIIAKASKIYDQYEGIESIKEVETNIYDSETKKLLENKKLKLKAKDFFYKKPVSEVIEYYKDGKKADPKDHKSGKKSKPITPVFDKDSKKNYDIKVVGSKIHRNVDCYKLKVTPKKKSETLFKGEMLVSKKTLSVMYLSGTISEFPRFMENFQIKIDYKTENFPSESVGEVTLHLDVPIFYSNKLIKSKFKTFNPVPIKK